MDKYTLFQLTFIASHLMLLVSGVKPYSALKIESHSDVKNGSIAINRHKRDAPAATESHQIGLPKGAFICYPATGGGIDLPKDSREVDCMLRVLYEKYLEMSKSENFATLCQNKGTSNEPINPNSEPSPPISPAPTSTSSSPPPINPAPLPSSPQPANPATSPSSPPPANPATPPSSPPPTNPAPSPSSPPPANPAQSSSSPPPANPASSPSSPPPAIPAQSPSTPPPVNPAPSPSSQPPADPAPSPPATSSPPPNPMPQAGPAPVPTSSSPAGPTSTPSPTPTSVSTPPADSATPSATPSDSAAASFRPTGRVALPAENASPKCGSIDLRYDENGKFVGIEYNGKLYNQKQIILMIKLLIDHKRIFESFNK